MEVFLNIGTLTMTNSTISGNHAGQSGGGIYSDNNFTAINSIIWGNDANVSSGFSTQVTNANFGIPQFWTHCRARLVITIYPE